GLASLPPSTGPRGVPPSAPRPVTPTHVYQAGSQMMMIPQQQLSFAGSPQGPAYFIPGQYRSPTYVATPQQYQVPAGTPSFYQSTTPAEYGTYGKRLYSGIELVCLRYVSVLSTAGAYYPAQPQFTPQVQAAPVIMNPAPQQQQPPPQPSQHIHTKRERKQIRIRDPNQGGRDITEEIMSGGRSGSTPTPPQVSGTVSLTCFLFILFVSADDQGTRTPPLSQTPEPARAAPVPSETTTDTNTKAFTPPPLSESKNTPPTTVSIPESRALLADVMDAPLPPRGPNKSGKEAKEEVMTEEGPAVENVDVSLEISTSQPSSSNGVAEAVLERPSITSTASHPEEPLESPIAQPEELRLPNGLPLPAPGDPEAPAVSMLEHDDSPIAEPDVSQQPVPTSSVPEAVKETVTASAVAAELSASAVEDASPEEATQSKPIQPGNFLIQEQVVVRAEPEPAPAPEPKPPAASPPVPEEADLTWEDKEDKLDAENIQPDPQQPSATDMKYQYKEDQWKPINMEEKKKYDREFLLGFQFISASMNKPEGLPAISDVVLDRANKTPLRQLDPSRLSGMNCGPDFTPSFANLGRPGMGGGRGLQVPRKEQRKIITSMSLSDDVQLNKAEKAWKPSVKKPTQSRVGETFDENDPEQVKTQELFKRVRSILNKLTPQKFQQLMKQVQELTVDTEERLKGVIDLTFEKAISEPDFSVAYANMCRCLSGLKVLTPDKPGVTVNFRKLLLNRCQKEFEKDKDDDEIFEKKQKELEAASVEEEKQRLVEELAEAKDKARRRSMGNIKFIGELFKLKMLTEVIMHDCILKLLKNHDEESLECLCRLLSTIGKDLDFEKAKPRMDQYFNQMEKIIKERKTSSRIRFMLQDVLDLRRNNWVPRRGDQGPKTIDQIHKDAELEEHREQMKVQQALISKNESSSGPRGRMGAGGPGGRGGPHTPGRGGPPQDDGWNTVPISKNRPIDTSRLSKITKTPVLDFNNQLLAPGGKGTWGSWGKGSSGGSSAKPSGSRSATSTLNRFSALQQPSSVSATVSMAQKTTGSERFERRGERRDDRDRNQLQVTKRSFSREKEEHKRERDPSGSADRVRRVASMTDDKGSRERARSKEEAEKRETAATPPPHQTPSKPILTEEEVERKSTAIIEEYLHINDMKEALQCVQELKSTGLLFVFVRNGLESTLERSTIAREHMGQLLHQLIKTGILAKDQYYKGFQEILEVAEDMAIDIPHIFLYLAELLTPMLHEGGIPMGELFREISKPLIPLGKAGVLLVHILTLLCKEMSHKKAGTMWREAGLRWTDFLPEDVDVNKFVTEKNVEFTLGDESEGSRKELSSSELSRQLDRLIQDKADNQRIFDWVEANLNEQQASSNTFIRALMTCICQSAIICENPYKVDGEQIKQRAKLLQRYLKDEQKELQALYALQALMVQMEQPANLLRMFFDTLYDEDVIKEEAFYEWESSKDPAEQQGKGVALKSVTAFFTWLREAEDESDNS
uniref:Eukaryotic translation initiation factor 4 gamma 1 n=1 Tax=Nothobranchius furzeri TaxID=105023 RepID=A0A8C6M1P0_NOTFU